MTSTDDGTERIIAVATELFAELGFDGTSLRMIADAAGVGVASVTDLVGGKTDLYRAVMMRAHEAERAALADATVAFTPTRQGMAGVVDAYFDFYAGNPRMVSLWLHRRMGDAADIAELEELYVRPPFARLAGALRGAAPEDIDIDYALWTIPWLISGFLSSGIMHSDPDAHGHGEGMHLTPQDLADFRRYLHQVVELLLPLPA
ncbi:MULTISPECIES: TetR/AcrR family transcriptional regulator [Actinomadura]|uniref:TetR/AcrR family transcriptional regulator n=1 Tax=Actinomadura yumaensis TaxID=111807 RepID=A0ABW2CD54_9ACTN|nr:TetR/AcrR family transcriptional regulator [Actinomadura sp. J1-007]MWK38111.1 TetR family transcriptional regulator [Actinomadura sp. J1-007]